MLFYKLRSELSDAKVKIEELERKLRNWKNSYEALESRYESLTSKDAQEATHLVDFETMQAFSIERMPSSKENHPITNIGYTVVDHQGGVHVKEWTMYTTLAQHNELVEQYRHYLSKRK